MAFGNRVTRLIYTYSPVAVRNLMTTLYSSQRGKVKFGPKYYEYFTDLERTQWYGEDELLALQEEKLRKLIHYAATYIPYYRGMFQEYGLQPGEIYTASDLSKLPILEKATVQTNLQHFRSTLYQDPHLVEHFQSSGTTGKAIDVFVSKDCLQLEKAFTWLHRSWGGVRLNDRAAGFVGFPVMPLRQRTPPFWVHDRSENRMIYSLQHMSRSNLPYYAASLQEYQPVMVYGYPTAIYLMALQLNEMKNVDVRPKAVFTASETLLPHQRQEMERAFACQVFDWYGAVELIANVVQCEQGNYHIKPEYGVVEILRPDGAPAAAGEQGELICTGLNNLAMPFIRYRISDRAVLKGGNCACGRGGTLVEHITGRVEDVIVTPDGRWLSRLDFVFKGMQNVVEAQLVQESPDSLRIRLVKQVGFSDRDSARLRANLQERLGNDMRIDFEYLDRIPRTSNGKFRYVISKVPLGFTQKEQTGEIIGVSLEEDRTL